MINNLTLIEFLLNLCLLLLFFNFIDPLRICVKLCSFLSSIVYYYTIYNSDIQYIYTYISTKEPCQKLSNDAGNRILNLMQLMTIFRKSSNSMDTTAGRFPVITISMTGCCFRKTQRHRTRKGAMPLCLFCNIQFSFCCLGKFFFSVHQFIFLLFRQAVENFLIIHFLLYFHTRSTVYIIFLFVFYKVQ